MTSKTTQLTRVNGAPVAEDNLSRTVGQNGPPMIAPVRALRWLAYLRRSRQCRWKPAAGGAARAASVSSYPPTCSLGFWNPVNAAVSARCL